jgi:hypothetical protein
MRRLLLSTAALASLGACAQIDAYSSLALEQRRQMNDTQARLTMAATCDISVGAFYRELSTFERQYAALVCGGVPPAAVGFPTEFAGEVPNG